LLESGVYPARPGPVIESNGQQITMDAQQHDAFVAAVGQLRRQYVESVVTDSKWPEASPDDRREALRRAVARGKADTIKTFFTPETLPTPEPTKKRTRRPVPSRAAQPAGVPTL
jgi:hypothetical protein